MANDAFQRFRTSTLARALVFGVAYLAGAELGHILSAKTDGQAFANFWPPAGLYLATLVLTEPRSSWLAIIGAACGASLISDVLLHNCSIAVSLGYWLANTIEACLGAWLLLRFAGLPFTLLRTRNVLTLAYLAALVGPAIGATVGTGIVTALTSQLPYGSAWLTWWIGHGLGVLIVAPVMFCWVAERASFFHANRPGRIVECMALFLGLCVVTEGVYGQWLPLALTAPALVLPFLLWAALRFGPSGASFALLVVTVIGLWNISHGRGPYIVLTALPSEQMLRAQAALCVTSLCVLLLAAAVSERKQAEADRMALIASLQQALAEIKTLRDLLPICAWCKRIRDDKHFWHSVEDYITVHTASRFSHGMCPDCLARELGKQDDGAERE